MILFCTNFKPKMMICYQSTHITLETNTLSNTVSHFLSRAVHSGLFYTETWRWFRVTKLNDMERTYTLAWLNANKNESLWEFGRRTFCMDMTFPWSSNEHLNCNFCFWPDLSEKRKLLNIKSWYSTSSKALKVPNMHQWKSV